MFARAFSKPRVASEGEKPFWISYADLMTAMMTLFLAAMVVTIIAIAQEVKQELSAEEIRAGEILDICNQMAKELKNQPHITVNCIDNRISFGEVGRFGYNDYKLPQEAGQTLADLIPAVLKAANSELGKKWFKQIVIEGYTDTKGSYLFNLHLSLNRSEWVMCQLIDPARNAALSLTPDQLRQVRELFLAGGVSFNNARDSDAESRRVEMRLQFYGRGEKEKSPPRPTFESPSVDRCQLS
jgi:outer membrane protein OmpA-like peptidoglycan-associated protein